MWKAQFYLVNGLEKISLTNTLHSKGVNIPVPVFESDLACWFELFFGKYEIVLAIF